MNNYRVRVFRDWKHGVPIRVRDNHFRAVHMRVRVPWLRCTSVFRFLFLVVKKQYVFFFAAAPTVGAVVGAAMEPDVPDAAAAITVAVVVAVV